jgi:hypothetical protein
MYDNIGNTVLKLALGTSDVFAYDFATDVREWRQGTSKSMEQEVCTEQLMPYKLYK